MSPGHAFDSQWLIHRLRELLPLEARPRYCVAYSGGMDSTVLLAALAAARHEAARRGRAPAFALRALHVQHGLHPHAPQWSRQCSRFAAALDVGFGVLRVKVKRDRGQSLEALAREARYGALGAALRAGEVLLTAQHLDDQFETVLLQLMRGAGLAGLAAMPPVAPFAQGQIVRPLLDCRRATLLAWARTRGLAWIEDSSNEDTSLDRNYLRHRVVPLLLERWPGAATAVSRAARHAGEAQQLLTQLGLRDLARVADGEEVAVQGLRRVAGARRRNLLRCWIASRGLDVPDTRRLQQIAGPVLDARPDANPEVRWANLVLRREQGRLRIEQTSATFAGAAPLLWCPARARTLHLPHGQGTLRLVTHARGAVDLDKLPEQLLVTFRAGNQSAALKRILQEARVPASRRASLPLLYEAAVGNRRLLAVADCWLDPGMRAGANARRRAQLRWLAPRRPIAV